MSTVPLSFTGVELTERSARVAWSLLIEGEDQAAHAWVRTDGAVSSFEQLLSGAPPRVAARLFEVLREGGAQHAGLAQQVESRVNRWMQRIPGLDLTATMSSARNCGARVVVPGSPGWHPGLDDLAGGAPLCLWVRGPVEPGQVSRSIAVVGSRAATLYGEDAARTISAGLVAAGVTVISGGAFGIDTLAHRGALSAASADAAANPATVAVLAGGVDVLYPRANSDLLLRVAESGAIFSEAPPGAQPMRFRFLQRNRLIAALAGATIVVEASHRSGALSTARRAVDLLRPVGAVPGPITSLASVGCHMLLREHGAVCVTDAQSAAELVQYQAESCDVATQLALGDAMTPLGADDSYAASEPASRVRWDALDEAEFRVIDGLSSRGYRGVSSLAKLTGLGVVETHGILARLSLNGHVVERSGAFRRVKSFDTAAGAK